jgi:cysteinyl-tRNA synthetase
MITINGQKMGKSLGNFITLDQLFTGFHELLAQAYSPMTIRFFILQAHYRSTLDFGNEALQAAEKGLTRLLTAVGTIDKIIPGERSTVDISDLEIRFRDAMNDDLNTPIAISVLFDWVRTINQLYEKQETISQDDLSELHKMFHRMVFDTLGLRNDNPAAANDIVTPLVEMLLEMRTEAKARKDWASSDSIRDRLASLGIEVKDRKDGYDWSIR